MAYLGTPPRSRVLSSADIDPGSVSLDDISFTDQPASMNISGNIDKHTMRLADQVVVNGDLDITDNLILSKISDDGNAITLTTDGSTRTIEGTGGSLEASTLTQTPNASLTGMTGIVGSGVTIGGDATFPTNHIVNITHSSGLGTNHSSNSNSWVDSGCGLSCTFTAGNKILIIANLFAGASGGGNDVGMKLKIRDETNNADVPLPDFAHTYAHEANGSMAIECFMSFNQLYTPPSGTSITFQVYHWVPWGGTSVFNANKSMMTLLEVQT